MKTILFFFLSCASIMAGDSGPSLPPTSLTPSNGISITTNGVNNFTITDNESTNYHYNTFTNGTTGAPAAFNTYFTNTFGGQITVYATFKMTDQVATGVQVCAYMFNTNQPFISPPLCTYVAKGIVDSGTNMLTFDLGAWDYVAFSNTLGTATTITNLVQF